MRADVAIVGNGVAGTACAMRLAREGIRSLLIGRGLPVDRPPLSKSALVDGVPRLLSDAARLEERGIDRLGMLEVARFLSTLIVKIAGGTVEGYEDVEAQAYQSKYIDIQLDKLNSFAGMEYPMDKVKGILSSLGFSVSGEAPLTPLSVAKPPYGRASPDTSNTIPAISHRPNTLPGPTHIRT